MGSILLSKLCWNGIKLISNWNSSKNPFWIQYQRWGVGKYTWLFVTFLAAAFWDKLTKHASTTWHTGAPDNQNIPQHSHNIHLHNIHSHNIHPNNIHSHEIHSNIIHSHNIHSHSIHGTLKLLIKNKIFQNTILVDSFLPQIQCKIYILRYHILPL